jgi:di/tricarboxylate transporter
MLKGVAIPPLLATIATGVLIWFIPAPPVCPVTCGMQLLAIFLSIIVGIITQPLLLGAITLLGLGVAVLTRTLNFAAAFSTFGDPSLGSNACACKLAEEITNTLGQ